MACMELKEWNCSYESFQRCIELEPSNPTPYANLGTAFFLQQNWTQAEFWWLTTLEQDPNHLYANRGLRALYQTESKQ